MSKPISKTADCFEEFVKLRGAAEADTNRLNAIIQHVESLKVSANAAREKFYATLELSDFKSWAKARAELYNCDSCSQEFSRSFGALTVRQAGTPEAKEIVTSCLKAMKAHAETQADKIRVEMAELLERVSGRASSGDHP